MGEFDRARKAGLMAVCVLLAAGAGTAWAHARGSTSAAASPREASSASARAPGATPGPAIAEPAAPGPETGEQELSPLSSSCEGEAAATPTIRLAVEMIPSLAPSTAARSQPIRSKRCVSL